MAYKFCATCKHNDSGMFSKPCVECMISGRAKARWERADEAQPTGESVNHPAHYNQGKYECIDVMLETFGKEATQHFCLLNAFKYIWRTGEKNGVEDVKKARWYLDKFLELEGETDE